MRRRCQLVASTEECVAQITISQVAIATEPARATAFGLASSFLDARSAVPSPTYGDSRVVASLCGSSAQRSADVAEQCCAWYCDDAVAKVPVERRGRARL